jgi:hypothetical protein
MNKQIQIFSMFHTSDKNKAAEELGEKLYSCENHSNDDELEFFILINGVGTDEDGWFACDDGDGYDYDLRDSIIKQADEYLATRIKKDKDRKEIERLQKIVTEKIKQEKLEASRTERDLKLLAELKEKYEKVEAE